ncbi:sensor histidine kinase [Qipengyuania mesophila]|uniref:sensor histidine kinase n=1 Tax=Qipengyuania mesophila TaxID=2867246 RepID=UPI003515D577
MIEQVAPRPVVAIFAPLAGDAEAIAGLVAEMGYESDICGNPASFFEALETHPLCAILTEEAISEEAAQAIERHSGAAPLWSSIPLILAIGDPEHLSRPSQKIIDSSATATVVVLQRPLRKAVFTTVCKSQIQLRERQFQAAAMMERLAEGEQYQRFLLDELRHRTRNMLGILQATVKLASKNCRDIDEFREELLARLQSISLAHERLTKEEPDEGHLKTIIHDHVSPFSLAEDKLELEGPEIVLSEGLTFDFSLVLHELATNAAKYGALSAADGVVRVEWERRDRTLAVTWQERGGPTVSAPSRQSFGTRMIERLTAKYDGTSAFDYQPEGLRVDLSLAIGEEDSAQP